LGLIRIVFYLVVGDQSRTFTWSSPHLLLIGGDRWSFS